MDCNNCNTNQNKITKTTTKILATFLALSFAVTMFSSPSMMGTAQAQTNPPPGGEQACGPNQFLFQGNCYREAQAGSCPVISFNPSPPGPLVPTQGQIQPDGTCTYQLQNTGQPNQNICSGAGGSAAGNQCTGVPATGGEDCDVEQFGKCLVLVGQPGQGPN